LRFALALPNVDPDFASTSDEEEPTSVTEPSVDPGYPIPAHGKIPSFTSAEEEAAFWDTHDITDFIEGTSPVSVTTDSELGIRGGRTITN
jgi:hypothetical protein